MPKTQENTVSNAQPQQSNVNQIYTTATKSEDEESVNYLTCYHQLYKHVYDYNYDSGSDDYIAAISSDEAHQLEPLNP